MKRIVTAPAKRDIADVLDWSLQQHGAAARRRYERLIARALKAVTSRADPGGSRAFDEEVDGRRTYHLRNSRRGASGPQVGAPRHLLVYARPQPDLIVMLRLLHDAMDVPARLQNER